MRDINQLHPRLIDKVYELIDLCAKNGITIKIGECLRTKAEQDSLYAQGRTKPGSIVTNCKGSTYSSMHQWGVAFDFYLYMDVDRDGKVTDDAFNNSTGLFDKVGKLGQSIGLEWGGSWKSIKDRPHFQLPDWGPTASKLKSAYGTPEKFMATWSTAKKPSTPATPAPAAPTTEAKTNYGSAIVTTSSSSLTIRSTPDTSRQTNKVGSVPKGKTVELVQSNAANGSGLIWAKIIYNGKSGYVAQKYLSIVSYPKTETVSTNASSGNADYSKTVTAPAQGKNASYAGTYKTTTGLNLRNAPGTSGTVVYTTMDAGSSVQNYGFYTNKDGTVWMLVAFGKYTGYCSKKYLQKVG